MVRFGWVGTPYCDTQKNKMRQSRQSALQVRLGYFWCPTNYLCVCLCVCVGVFVCGWVCVNGWGSLFVSVFFFLNGLASLCVCMCCVNGIRVSNSPAYEHVSALKHFFSPSTDLAKWDWYVAPMQEGGDNHEVYDNAHTCTLSLTQKHARTHARTRSLTHTHTHTLSLSPLWMPGWWKCRANARRIEGGVQTAPQHQLTRRTRTRSPQQRPTSLRIEKATDTQVRGVVLGKK